MILIDTSGLLAALDPRQAGHAAAAEVLVSARPRILSPFVLAELDYLITVNAGQEQARTFLHDVARGAYRLEAMDAMDVAFAAEIIEQYVDLRPGLADASIVVLAHRYGCFDILTLDERHFRVSPGQKGQPFRLLPRDWAERSAR